MAKLNVKRGGADRRKDATERLAGGMGTAAAVQEPEALLRRAVLANLLWENVAYQDGETIADQIRALVPQVAPDVVAGIAVEARTKQKLRHVPLLLVREMARHATHKAWVGELLPAIIRRPDELTEFLAIYWQGGKCPLSKQVRIGLGKAFKRFDAYSLAKYNRDGAIRLRDVLFLTHPQPDTPEQAALWAQLANNALPTPDTWEVALSAGADKKATWERLITEGKLKILAFLRNLRNMEQAGVDPKVIRQGFATIDPSWALPLNFLAAARHAPRWERELEPLMLRCLEQAPRLPGRTILVLDVSGSMGATISAKSKLTRLDAAASMAMLAGEMCESLAVYATAGSDSAHEHATIDLRPRRGFALIEDVRNSRLNVGGGGIFTRQCLEYIRTQEREKPDRIIIFSDSQDCDHPNQRVPAPFGHRNYIVDVSAHTRGVNYAGVWTAEISGWSATFLNYIAALEGVNLPTSEEHEEAQDT